MFSEANLWVELQDKTFDNSCCGSDSLCVCKGFKSQGLLARYGGWESDDFWFVDKSLIRRIVPSGQRARSRAVTRLQTQDSGHSPSCKTHRLQSNIDLQRPFLGRAQQIASICKSRCWDGTKIIPRVRMNHRTSIKCAFAHFDDFFIFKSWLHPPALNWGHYICPLFF